LQKAPVTLGQKKVGDSSQLPSKPKFVLPLKCIDLPWQKTPTSSLPPALDHLHFEVACMHLAASLRSIVISLAASEPAEAPGAALESLDRVYTEWMQEILSAPILAGTSSMSTFPKQAIDAMKLLLVE
jgi:hypothetical protein